MANYVLGPSAARKLQEMMRGRMTSGRIDGGGARGVDEQGFAHPFEVTWAASSGENGAGAWIVWLPEGCLLIDGEAVDVTAGLSAAEGYPEGWYVVEALGDHAERLFLVVRFGDGESDDDGGAVEVEFSEVEADEEDDAWSIPVAEFSGRAVKQVVTSALVLSTGAAESDEASIDDLGGDNGGKLQLAHFADTERDSKKGLAARLKADPETGAISADGDDSVMLVARKSGQVIYIPLSGGEGDDDVTDPEPEPEVADPCGHPGTSGAGGVVAGGDGGSSDAGGGGGGGAGYGGVSAGGDTHAGSNDCCGKK